MIRCGHKTVVLKCYAVLLVMINFVSIVMGCGRKQQTSLRQDMKATIELYRPGERKSLMRVQTMSNLADVFDEEVCAVKKRIVGGFFIRTGGDMVRNVLT